MKSVAVFLIVPYLWASLDLGTPCETGLSHSKKPKEGEGKEVLKPHGEEKKSYP
jgi:hypothetical protein